MADKLDINVEHHTTKYLFLQKLREFAMYVESILLKEKMTLLRPERHVLKLSIIKVSRLLTITKSKDVFLMLTALWVLIRLQRQFSLS